MDRPRSMTGNSVQSTTSSMHKRNASLIKPPPKSQSTSATSLLVTNLKLLNFDLLPDWPNLSTLSFSSADSRNRIRCTEWTLYHLFRLFDPQMTAEKLQPFFPPLEHLQSINLRAALHRCLNDLKKNGVLGRDTILRKTMLDDCSGEKFWELCLSFSSVVLRKATLDCRPRSVQPLARRYASMPISEKKERESLLPMAIVHKAALTKVLNTKTRRRENFMRLSDMMTAKEDELLVRLDAIEEGRPIVESPAHAEELEAIEQALCHSSISNAAVLNAVVNGDSVKPGDMLLLQSKHEFLSQLDSDSQTPDERRDSGVLDDLQRRANAQRARVGQWQALYDQFRARKTSISEDQVSAGEEGPAKDIFYDRHHELSLENTQLHSPLAAAQPEPTPSYISRYEEILTAMREELRRAQKLHRQNTIHQNRPMPTKKPSITLDAVAGARNVSLSRSSSRRSISPTIPFRPGLGRRVSSRPKSYQQPRVVSQREPIPFKSEPFSPIKAGTSGDSSPAHSLSSAVESMSITPSYEAQKPVSVWRESQGSMGTNTIDSGIGLGVDLSASPVEVHDAAENTLANTTPATLDSPDPGNSKILGSSLTATELPSLSERTRQSMAIGKGDFDPSENTSPAKRQTSPLRPMTDELDTLAARTRLSMSAFTAPSPTRQASSVANEPDNDPVSSISVTKTRLPSPHRTNGMSENSEAPSHSNTLSIAAYDSDARRDITPREKLFEADAEASSVFKSRPKIATSPVMSPAPAHHDVVDDTWNI